MTTSTFAEDRSPWARDLPYWALFACAVATLIVVQATLAPVNGFWLDELFSLETTDPAIPFVETFTQRIAPDTNPPLYMVILRLVRDFVSDDRSAFIAVALIFLVSAVAFALWTATRARMAKAGLLACAAFIASGPVLTYFPEGRVYFPSMCIAFATSWAAGLNVVAGRRVVGLAAFCVLGVAASLSHVFSTIFAGSVAASLVAYGVLSRRKDLLMPGLVLGVSTTIVFAVWFATVQNSLHRVSWIQFTLSDVRAAFWYARVLAIGPGFMLIPLAGILLYALRANGARPLLTVFGAVLFLFAALPMAASFVTPIITGRYWAIGAPLIPVLLVFVGRAYLQWSHPTARWAAAATALLIVVTTGFGIMTARTFTLDKPSWDGAPTVAIFGRGCPAASIRVSDLMMSNGVSLITQLPETTFVDATKPDIPTVRLSATECPVIGWSEHFLPVEGYNQSMPDEALLARLRLDVLPGDVEIIRHKSGYVVLKAGTRNAQAADPIRRISSDPQ